MRCLALVAVLAFAGSAAAQPGQYLAEISVDSVQLRAGPSDAMPDLGSLNRGATVVVDHEDGEWVAVQPPRGQVSWIKNVSLEPAPGQAADALPRNAIVHADPDTEIAFGRPGVAKPLDVRRNRVPDQTIVQVIGKKVDVAGVGWLPIEPPDGDFRFLPKSSVRPIKNRPAQSFVVRDPKPSPEAIPASVANPVNGGNRAADWPTHPLWQQAEQAERAGDYTRAEQMYLKLAAEMNKPGGDGDLANLCYTRVHAVREKARNGGGRTSSAGGRDTPPPAPANGPEWVGPGSLRLAGIRVEGKTTFALVGPSNKVIVYVLAGPDLDLERHRGSEVEIYGRMTHPGDLRGAGIMTASQVRAAK